MVSVAPASLSMAALMSPVCAPLSAAWQSCPPMVKPGAARTPRSMSVAGRHRATSQAAVSAAMDMEVTSARSAPVPCIFQLPATSFFKAIASPSFACRLQEAPLKRRQSFSKRECVSMISWFRRLSKSALGITLSVIFLVAILAGFALQDIRSVGSGALGFNPGTLAKVGDGQVTERELSSLMQRQLNELRQQNPNADYSSMAGDFPKILDSLIQSRAILEFAHD